MKEFKDPPIDEIRAIRHQISEEFGHDPYRLAEHLMQLQEQEPHKHLLLRSDSEVKLSIQEEVLVVDWLRPEEEAAWDHLQPGK